MNVTVRFIPPTPDIDRHLNQSGFVETYDTPICSKREHWRVRLGAIPPSIEMEKDLEEWFSEQEMTSNIPPQKFPNWI